MKHKPICVWCGHAMYKSWFGFWRCPYCYRQKKIKEDVREFDKRLREAAEKEKSTGQDENRAK